MVVRGDSTTLPFATMCEAPFTDEPSLDVALFARTRARLAPAVGSSLHLAGDGGDVVLAAPLTYLADLARNKSMRRLVHEATAWARLRQRPAYRVLYAAGRSAHTAWRDTLLSLADQLCEARIPSSRYVRSGIEGALTWASLAPAAAWGTRQARESVATQLRQTCTLPVPDYGADGHAWRAIRWHANATGTYIQIAAALGVKVHVPYFDNQVIAACMSLSAADRTTALRAKPLLGAALRGRVPAAVLDRRTKGDYSACEYHGLRQAAGYLRALLDSSLLADYGVLNPRPAAEALKAAINGSPAPLGALTHVFTTEAWLRRLPARPRTCWVPGAAREVRT